MQDLDPHLLRAFLSVIDVGTVNGAAAALHRTQAAVSMQIRRLEDIAGAPLFERSPKGLMANAEGRILEPYAREILTLNEEVRQRISGQRMEGRVKLGVVEDFAATRLIGILKFFRDPYEMTLFPDGRAIIKGTTDTAVARSLYARFVGS